MDKDKILDELKSKAKEVNSTTLNLTIADLARRYETKRIDIKPKFQRAFRWSHRQRSLLIESIFLKLPLPTIFAVHNEDGDWEIIDGVQRISTILSFMGVLGNEDPVNDMVRDKGNWPRLNDLEHLKMLEGAAFDELPQVVQHIFEDSPIPVTLVDHTSSKDAKFHMFQRLNGGSVLTEQELRAASLLFRDEEFFDLVYKLSDSEHFQQCVKPSESKQLKGFNQELILRFMAQIDWGDEPIIGASQGQDFGDFLTKWMLERVEDRDFQADAASKFERSMSLIASELGSKAFVRYNSESGKYRGGFSTAAYEFILSGLTQHLEYFEENPHLIRSYVEGIWSAPAFNDNSGQGVNARDRFPRMVTEGRKYFNPE